MRNLKIAVCRSRKDKRYHNQEIAWSELIDRLKDTVRTHETVNEYRAMSKARQADIKDVGGFVAGYLKDGKRGKEYILILSTAGTKIESGRKYIWDSIEAVAKAEYGERYTVKIPVEVPYVVDLVHIPSVYFMDVMSWTGDFTKCLGWMMLFPNEIRRVL